MIFPIFTSLVILTAFFAFLRHHAERKAKAEEDAFWARERESNLVARKPMDDLVFITIPYGELPTQYGKEDEKIASCLAELETFREKKIVNLLGYSNTDLKIKYGTLNLTQLTEYDNNFIRLAALLQNWALALNERKAYAEAYAVCRFAVDIGSDSSKTYRLLSDLIFREELCPVPDRLSRLEDLEARATLLPSIMKNSILKDLSAKKEACRS